MPSPKRWMYSTTGQHREHISSTIVEELAPPGWAAMGVLEFGTLYCVRAHLWQCSKRSVAETQCARVQLIVSVHVFLCSQRAFMSAHVSKGQ